MNRAPCKLALINLNTYHHFYLKTALFHSTPVLGRRPCTHSRPVNARRVGPVKESKGGKYNAKKEKLRNAYNGYPEDPHLKGGRDDEYDPFRSYERWYRNHSGGPERFSETRDSDWDHGRARDRDRDRDRIRNRKKGFQSYDDDYEVRDWHKKGSRSSEDDEEDDKSHWNFSFDSNNNNQGSWNWRQRFEGKENNKSSEPNILGTDLKNERIALGLSGSGKLSLEDVKTAYHACAMKWHPDRHNGPSKAIAEEKFKVCSAAYESLREHVI